MGVYFLTFGTQDRVELFGCNVDGAMALNEWGRHMESIWLDLPSHYPGVSLDAFVIMPDHIHGILVIDDTIGSVPAGHDPVDPARTNGRSTKFGGRT